MNGQASKYSKQILRDKLCRKLEKELPICTVRAPSMKEMAAEPSNDDWTRFLSKDDQALLHEAYSAAKKEAMDNASDQVWPPSACL